MQRSAAAILCLLLLSSPVRAEAPADADQPAPPNWSIGAGFGVSNLLAYPGVAGLGTTSTAGLVSLGALSPVAQVGLERRLAGGLWMQFQLRGTLSRYTTPGVPMAVASTSQTLTSGTEGDAAWGGLALGFRHVFAATKLVSVFWFALVNGAGFAVNSHRLDVLSAPAGGSETKTESFSKMSGLSIGGSAGFGVDVKLLDSLALRVGTTVLDVNYQTSTQVETKENTVSPAVSPWAFTGGLSLAPYLLLQAKF